MQNYGINATKGQGTVEYALGAALALAAFIAGFGWLEGSLKGFWAWVCIRFLLPNP